MKKPWETWVLRGLSINEAAPLFEKMERIQMEPWGHTFGWKDQTLADGRIARIVINKNGIVPVYSITVLGIGPTAYSVPLFDNGFLVGSADSFSAAKTIYTDNRISNLLNAKTDLGCSLQPAQQNIIGNSYVSQVWDGTRPQPTVDPGGHSGLGKLFTQSLLGTGIDISAVLPDGWTYDPKQITLIRDQQGTYWLVNLKIRTDITSAECVIQRMQISDAMQCVEDNIRDGTLTGFAAELGQARVLASLTIPDGVDAEVILADEDFDDVFEQGIDSNDPVNISNLSWQWAYQKTGKDDALAPKACLTVTRKTNLSPCVFRTKTCVLSLTRTGATLVPDIDITDGNDFIISSLDCSLCTTGDGTTPGIYAVDMFKTNCADSTILNYYGDPEGSAWKTEIENEAILHAWYDVDGLMKYVKTLGYSTQNDSYIDYAVGDHGFFYGFTDAYLKLGLQINEVDYTIKASRLWAISNYWDCSVSVTDGDLNPPYVWAGTITLGPDFFIEETNCGVIAFGKPGSILVYDTITYSSALATIPIRFDLRYPLEAVKEYPGGRSQLNILHVDAQAPETIMSYELDPNNLYGYLMTPYGLWQGYVADRYRSDLPNPLGADLLTRGYFYGVGGTVSYDLDYIVTKENGFNIVDYVSEEPDTLPYELDDVVVATEYKLPDGMPAAVISGIANTHTFTWIGAV